MDERTEQIYSKFAAENWGKMTSEQRLEALNELEAVSAGQNNSAVRQVVAEDMNGKVYGYFDGEKIVVNNHLLQNDPMFYARVTDEDGNQETLTYRVEDANIQMMDTLFHEDYHAFQKQAVNGEIPPETLRKMGISEETVRNWAANENRLGYVEPEIDGNLYRIQGLEKAAFDAGETNTKEAFSYLNQKYGEDANYQKYLSAIEANSYKKNLQMAQMRYGDMDIENTLQNKMNELNYFDHVSYENEISADDVEHVLLQSALHTNPGKGNKMAEGTIDNKKGASCIIQI